MPNFEPNDDTKMEALFAAIDAGDACDPATDVDGEECLKQLHQRIADRAKLKNYVPEGMAHADFEIGKTFICGGRKWRCTDIGTRVITAICLDVKDDMPPAAAPHVPPVGDMCRIPHHRPTKPWDLFAGPPYKVEEVVFDEYDFGGCSPDREDATGMGF